MVSVLLVCPFNSPPLKRHWKRSGGAPVAATLKVAGLPLVTVRLWGEAVMNGGSNALVVEVALLFALTTSTSAPETETVLAMLPLAVTWTTKVIMAEAPLFIAPKEQVKMPALRLQLPCEGVADKKLTAGGSALFRVTPDAPDGPPLLTVIE